MRAFLNIDVGELPREAEELYAVAHAVSIACGGHAGDASSMRRALELCKKYGTRAGAHPSYPDRVDFGRRSLAMDRGELAKSLRDQTSALWALAKEVRVTLGHVKPHGALYHDANKEPALAEIVCASASAVAVVGPAGGCLERATVGRPFWREGFADRAMREDGSLVPRTEAGAVITDPGAARAQARALVETGAYDTICVHGDNPSALAIARAVRDELDALA